MLIEIFDVVMLVYYGGYCMMISYCSGEMEDIMIVDFVVVIGSGQIKMGVFVCSECVVKYNQLLWIEEVFGDVVCYVGDLVFFWFVCEM